MKSEIAKAIGVTKIFQVMKGKQKVKSSHQIVQREKDERGISIFSSRGKESKHYETVGHHQPIQLRGSKNHCRLFSEDTVILLHSDQENLAIIGKHLKKSRKNYFILIRKNSHLKHCNQLEQIQKMKEGLQKGYLQD